MCVNACGETFFCSNSLYFYCVKYSSLSVWERGARREGQLKGILSYHNLLHCFPLGCLSRLRCVQCHPFIRHWWMCDTGHVHCLSDVHMQHFNHPKPKTKLCLPLGVLHPQAMSATHTPHKCTHAYTLSRVMNVPLRAELTSWDHFLLLFFFLARHTHSLISFSSLCLSQPYILFLTSSLTEF